MPPTTTSDLPLHPDRTRAFDANAARARIRAWASSDGSGDLDKIDTAKYAKAFLWHAGDGSNLTDYKGIVADVVDGKLYAIWRAVTALAAVMQGARGGIDVPAQDRLGIRQALAGYYAKARTAFNDPAITVPWTDMNQILRARAGR